MRVFITDGVHQLMIDRFKSLGCDVDYEPDVTYDEVKRRVGDYEGLIINSKVIVDRSFIDQSSQLKFVGRLGSGLEIIDLEYANEKGIKCFNSPEGNRNAVAEHAVAMLLGLFNNIRRASIDVKNWNWNREVNRGFELEGKTVGIFGYGHTGRSFAKCLRGFGCRVLAYDKYKSGFGDEYVEEVRVDDIFSQSDILSLHLPLTEETHHLVNQSFINQFQKEVYLLNTSRGKVVNLNDLNNELKRGKVKGVCLDVLENEKLEAYSLKEKEVLMELLKNDNSIITPHIAGWTYESKRKIAEVLLSKIESSFFVDL